MMRYPLILRAIHWLTALLLVPMLAGGYFVIRAMPSTDPVKLDALMYHMAIGVFIAALTLIRLALRWRLAPEAGSTLALWVHRATYAVIFLMPVTGFTMVFAARLNDIVFARTGAALPQDMAAIPGHWLHGLFALCLTLLIALHIAGAVKDRATLSRMV